MLACVLSNIWVISIVHFVSDTRICVCRDESRDVSALEFLFTWYRVHFTVMFSFRHWWYFFSAVYFFNWFHELESIILDSCDHNILLLMLLVFASDFQLWVVIDRLFVKFFEFLCSRKDTYILCSVGHTNYLCDFSWDVIAAWEISLRRVRRTRMR